MESAQIYLVRREVRKRGLNLTYVEDEAVDFLCCQIQERMNKGDEFEKAFNAVLEQANDDGMFRLKSKLITSNSINIMDMLKNYLKIAYRNFFRYKVNTSINIFGLVIGLVTSIIIGLYIKYETSYDNMYPDVDRLYRINTISNLGQTPNHLRAISPKLLTALQGEIPEIEMMTNFDYGFVDKPLHYNDNVFFDYRLTGVDADFSKMFGLKIIAGDASSFQENINSVLLSESMAKRVFADSDPIGKTFSIDAEVKQHIFKVDGVFKDLPSNTHFKADKWLNFDILVSTQTADGLNDFTKSWTSINDPGYIKLAAGTNEAELVTKINTLLKRQAGDDIWYEHYIQPVKDIHLNSRGFGIEAKGNGNQLYLFALIGILILVIACVNYVNLTTAQASARLKEVGVRKVIGASRRQFVIQFLIEAVLISSVAISLALIFVFALVPTLNSNFSLQLDFSIIPNLKSIIGFLGIMLFVSLLCGTYPGFYLSRLNANQLLKTSATVKAGGGLFRKVLVTLQYATSITLIIATLIIMDQLHFLRTKDLGFDKEQVVYVQLGSQLSMRYGETLFNEVEKESGVMVSSFTGNSLGDGSMSGNGILVGDMDKDSRQMHKVLPVDYGFQQTLGLEITDGRWFSEKFATDRKEGYIVNEAFVKHFSLENPIGVKLSRNGRTGKIVGVVKDFNYQSMHSKIEPLVLFMVERNEFGYINLAVRLRPETTNETLANLKKDWENVIPDYPFKYEFLDAKIDQYYKSDSNFAAMFQVFSLLAILVSCLGLIGLVAFTTHRKSKEIGVRKVLGASVLRILHLLSLDFVKLIFVGAIIAVPLAYFFMNNWLENFEYRITISYWLFAISLVITLVLSWLSVSYISYRAARANPVDALKQE